MNSFSITLLIETQTDGTHYTFEIMAVDMVDAVETTEALIKEVPEFKPHRIITARAIEARSVSTEMHVTSKAAAQISQEHERHKTAHAAVAK